MRKKVLFHISANQYNSNPKNHHTFKIWEELAKGFDEYHIFARNERMIFASSKFGNIHIHLLPSFGKRIWVFFFLSWLLPFYLLKYKATHLLAQCPVMGGLSSSFCSLIFRIPLMVEIHGSYYFKNSRRNFIGEIEHMVYKVLSKISFSIAKKIRVLSPYMSSVFIKTYGQSYNSKLRIIPVRVDVDNFIPKKNYHISDTLKIINVGRLCDNKNQVGLIQDLLNLKYNIELILVGKGEDEEAIRKMKEFLPPNFKVRLVGQVNHSQLAALLSSSDFYIHYAKYEGTPRAIIEAMAVGLPVLTKEIEYMNGILVHSQNAIVLNQMSTSEDLLRNINELINSYDERVFLGKNARQYIYDNYQWNVVFNLYRKELLEL